MHFIPFYSLDAGHTDFERPQPPELYPHAFALGKSVFWKESVPGLTPGVNAQNDLK